MTVKAVFALRFRWPSLAATEKWQALTDIGRNTRIHPTVDLKATDQFLALGLVLEKIFLHQCSRSSGDVVAWIFSLLPLVPLSYLSEQLVIRFDGVG
ncbi:unnamed protein product [Soboliphyme baturini]|uniref:Protein kinase domain-containing protein n=1 Tax=Soboliphyme baturini TaxID=241478 RepID=A0A183JAZ1_9BILA|nr:unnamed protein product [Soboliphyme baturini]